MSKQPLQGKPLGKKSSPRYTLPDGTDILLSDWKLRDLLDIVQKVLQSPDRPIGFVPTLQDVVELLQEVLALALASLEEPHYLRPTSNPEIISSGQVTPTRYQETTKLGTGSRTLGLSPSDEADEVGIVSNPANAGRPESKVTRTPRVLQDGKEPIPFYRFLQALALQLASFHQSLDSHSAQTEWGLWADRVNSSGHQGSPRSGGSKPGPIPSIASLASSFRRLKRKQGKGS